MNARHELFCEGLAQGLSQVDATRRPAMTAITATQPGWQVHLTSSAAGGRDMRLAKVILIASCIAGGVTTAEQSAAKDDATCNSTARGTPAYAQCRSQLAQQQNLGRHPAPIGMEQMTARATVRQMNFWR